VALSRVHTGNVTVGAELSLTASGGQGLRSAAEGQDKARQEQGLVTEGQGWGETIVDATRRKVLLAARYK
jgi:hypothetical protein